MSVSDRQSEIRDLITKYIKEAGPGGSVNQLKISEAVPAGNGLKSKDNKLMKESKKNDNNKRCLSQWQLFLKKYLNEHKDVPFSEAVKMASKEYREKGLKKNVLLSKSKGSAKGGAAMNVGDPAFAGPYLKAFADDQELLYPPVLPKPTNLPDVDPLKRENKEIKNEDKKNEEGGNIKSEITRRIKGVQQALKGVRMNYPPKTRKVLEKDGDKKFTDIRVCRKPLNPALQATIKSLAKKDKFDQFYHLSIHFKIGKNKWLRMDKREVIEADIVPNKEPETFCIRVEKSNETPDTVNKVLQKTLDKIGPNNFFVYKSTSLNCQRWIEDIVKSNGMKTDMRFIKQDVSDLFSDETSAASNFATNLKSKINLLTEGYGKRMPASNPNNQTMSDITNLKQNRYTKTASKKVMNELFDVYEKRAMNDRSLAGIGRGCYKCYEECSSESDDMMQAAEDNMMQVAEDGGTLVGGLKKRRANNYIMALKQYNAFKKENDPSHKYTVYKKGTDDYNKVMFLKDNM